MWESEGVRVVSLLMARGGDTPERDVGPTGLLRSALYSSSCDDSTESFMLVYEKPRQTF